MYVIFNCADANHIVLICIDCCSSFIIFGKNNLAIETVRCTTRSKGAFTQKAKLFFASPKTREFTRSTIHHKRRDAPQGAGLISVSRLRKDSYHFLHPPE